MDPLWMSGMSPEAAGILPYGVGGYPGYAFPGAMPSPQGLPFQPYVPLMAGTAPPFYQPFRLPMTNMLGVMGPLANMALAAPMQNFLASAGYFPGGMDRGVNFADRLFNAQFLQEQQQAMQYGAAIDRLSLSRTFQGLAQITGTPFGVEQARFADRFSGQLAAITPYVAPYAPGVVEQFMGPQGSATILTQNLALQGRYRMDPVTGLPGYSPETIRDVSSRIQRGFADDPRGFAGITMGETGVLFGELQRRGILSQSGSAPDGANPQQLRAFEGDRITRQLKEYTGVIRAMREIFGDAGQFDAPIPQLIQGLDQLTQGGLSRIPAVRLETTVRQIRNLAQNSGLGMEGFARISQFAGGEARAQGGGGTLGLEAAMGSAAYAVALRDGSVGAISGMPNLEELVQTDTRLRVAAGRSDLANRLGALEGLYGGEAGLERLRRQVGTANTPEARRALAYVEAYRSGRSTFVDPATGAARSLGEMRDDEFFATFSPLVGGNGTLAAIMGARGFNLQQGERYANLIRDTQLESDIRPQARQQLQAAFIAGLGDQANAGSAALAGTAADQLLATWSGMGSRAGDRAAVRQQFTEDLTKMLQQQGVPDAENRAASMAALAVANLGSMNPSMRFEAMGALFNSETRTRAAQATATADAQRMIQEQMATFGQFEGPLAAAIRAIQEAGPDTNLSDVLSQALGGIEISSLGASQAELQTLMDARTKFLTEVRQAPGDAQATSAAFDRFRTAIEPVMTGIQKREQTRLPVTVEDARRLVEAGTAISGFATADPRRAKELLGQRIAEGSEDTYQDALLNFVTGYEDAANRSLSSQEGLVRLGTPGEARTVKSGLEGAQRLRSLAAVYTDGDVGRLLAGDIPGMTEAKVQDVRKQAAQALASMQTGSSTLEKALSGSMTDEERAKRRETEGVQKLLDQYASGTSELPGSTQDLAKKLMAQAGLSTQDTDQVNRIAGLLAGREEAGYAQLEAVNQLALGGKLPSDRILDNPLGRLLRTGNRQGATLDSLEKALQSSEFQAISRPGSKEKSELRIDLAKIDVRVRVDMGDGRERDAEVLGSDVQFRGGDVSSTPTSANEI